MKSFNSKEHLEHPEWKVVTREGKPVRILCTDLDDNDYPVAAVVGNFHFDKYTAEGIFHAGEENKYDLFFAPKKYEGWTLFVNCESICPDILDSTIYATREEAQCMRETHPGRYGAIVKLEWEDEQ